MATSKRSSRRIWIGRGVAVLALVVLAAYFSKVGWDAADKVASTMGLLVAIAALVAPYLFPIPDSGGEAMAKPIDLADTGEAEAHHGGVANTGVEVDEGGRPIKVSRSGDATADGPGSVANTGVRQLSTDPE